MNKVFPLCFVLLWSSAFISSKIIVGEATPFARHRKIIHSIFNQDNIDNWGVSTQPEWGDTTVDME